MELALQVTDISLFADVGSSEDGSKDEMEAVRGGVGSVADEEDSCNTSLSKRKRIKETEKNDSVDSAGNLSTLWSQLNQDFFFFFAEHTLFIYSTHTLLTISLHYKRQQKKRKINKIKINYKKETMH